MRLKEEAEWRKVNRWTRWFLVSAGVILCATGAAKIWSGFGTVKLLEVADPIFGISFRSLMFGVGGAELAIAGVCLWSRASGFSALLVAWLGSNFLAYRMGLWGIGWKKPCGCLGNLSDALGLSPQNAEAVVKSLLVYLLVGSYGILLVSIWRRARKSGMFQPRPGSGFPAGT